MAPLYIPAWVQWAIVRAVATGVVVGGGLMGWWIGGRLWP